MWCTKAQLGIWVHFSLYYASTVHWVDCNVLLYSASECRKMDPLCTVQYTQCNILGEFQGVARSFWTLLHWAGAVICSRLYFQCKSRLHWPELEDLGCIKLRKKPPSCNSSSNNGASGNISDYYDQPKCWCRNFFSVWWKRKDWGWSQSSPTILSDPTLRSNSIHPNPSQLNPLQPISPIPPGNIHLFETVVFACTDKGCVLRSTPSKHLWQVVLPCPHTSRLLQPPLPHPNQLRCAVYFASKGRKLKQKVKWQRGGWGWFMRGGEHCTLFQFIEMRFQIDPKSIEKSRMRMVYVRGGIARRLTRSHHKRHMSPQVFQPAQTPERPKLRFLRSFWDFSGNFWGFSGNF